MKADAVPEKVLQHNFSNNDFTIQTVSEMCVEYVCHSDQQHTASDVSIH